MQHTKKKEKRICRPHVLSQKGFVQPFAKCYTIDKVTKGYVINKVTLPYTTHICSTQLYIITVLIFNLSLSTMLQPFTTFFTFLLRKAKSMLKQPRIKRKFSGLSTTSSFLHMELSSQFHQVFKLIDSNGDGKISSSELSEVLACLGYNKCTAAKEAEGMVRVLDFNGDGFVDLNEFMVVVMNGMEKEKEEEEMINGYLMDAFLVFDTDKNGLISAKELHRVLFNLGCENCSLRDCKRMIKAIDKNGDGFVDFEEFRCMMRNGVAS